MDFSLLWDNIRIIALLAITGLLLSTSIVWAIIHFGLGLPWRVVLFFGSLISATDPTSVMTILEELEVAKRLLIIVEGECLLNG